MPNGTGGWSGPRASSAAETEDGGRLNGRRGLWGVVAALLIKALASLEHSVGTRARQRIIADIGSIAAVAWLAGLSPPARRKLKSMSKPCRGERIRSGKPASPILLRNRKAAGMRVHAGLYAPP